MLSNQAVSFTSLRLPTIVMIDMNKNDERQKGAINGLAILTVVLLLLVMAFGSVMIWALVNYNDQKSNVDAKISKEVAIATKAQSEEDEKKFAERQKDPYRDFVGPTDLGRVTFNYPKTWSVYIDKEGQIYEAYLHPITVHPVSSKRPYALRVSISNKTYDRSLAEFESLVKKGELKSSPVTVNGFTGNRLDGVFPGDIEGSMVLFKVRDKTLRVYTESPSFRDDFNNIILESFSFNP